MSQKPSIPKGTRDFSPTEMVKRNYIFDTIKKVFQRYGYLPIETPAMETLTTLLGKYGEEGDKLIFKILNSGDFTIQFKNGLPNVPEGGFTFNDDYKQLTSLLSEKALRYDLTVPFARYVVQHQHEITFPFKRYQIQPVWRADRPQKGRYREFYQCDADVIGSDSLLNEVELVQMMDDVFTSLKVPVIIKINNRKVLFGIADYLRIYPNKIIDFITTLDKIEKIGYEAVEKEIYEKQMVDNTRLGEKPSHGVISYLKELLAQDPSNFKSFFDFWKQYNLVSNSMIKGCEEVELIFNTVNSLKLQTAKLHFDPTLARGLNYYTGAIIEVKVDNTRCKSEFTSSITGGGRYDDLTGIFGLPNMSGVGISFGADRIYDVMEELKLFPDEVAASTKLLFVTFGEKEQNYCLPLLSKVRKAGINAEMYPDATAKMKKQIGYADAKKIPFVVIVGGDEMESGLLSLKNMISGEQEKLSIEDIISKL